MADFAVDQVVQFLRELDTGGDRISDVFRNTYDQLYDGQRTGRYSWAQLFKTERTHFGTLLEINLRREFDGAIRDGVKLDYKIANYEIDCKYSQKLGGWMIPPEAFGELLLVCTASDTDSTWSMGVVRASSENLRGSSNRDGKTGLNAKGRASITWLHRDAELPPNVLLQIPQETVDDIFSKPSGQQRLNQLLRAVQNRRIGRWTIATVAQQDDFMKRLRANGGSRSALQPEGIIVLGGDYFAQREIARSLCATVPRPGEVVSVRVVPSTSPDDKFAEIEGIHWRLAMVADPVFAAPVTPRN